MAHSQESADRVIAWLRQNAIPLRHLEAGNGFDDLQTLKEIWRDARVIGLGESTHGRREFFQVKQRLLEFLVSEVGFPSRRWRPATPPSSPSTTTSRATTTCRRSSPASSTSSVPTQCVREQLRGSTLSAASG